MFAALALVSLLAGLAQSSGWLDEAGALVLSTTVGVVRRPCTGSGCSAPCHTEPPETDRSS